MQNFLQVKELIEYQFDNPYDEVWDALVLDFIKHVLDEKLLCKVEKVTSSKEAWKILEVEFGIKEADMQQEVVSRSINESIKNSTTDPRVDPKDYQRTKEL